MVVPADLSIRHHYHISALRLFLIRFFEVSSFQHQTKLCSRCGISLVSSLNLSEGSTNTHTQIHTHTHKYTHTHTHIYIYICMYGHFVTMYYFKPSLHNIVLTVANYYSYSTKQHVSALLGHHKAYKIVVLVKVQSVVNRGIP